MALRGDTDELKIWNRLKDAGMNDCGAAGMMGNLYAESGLKPNNLQNSYNRKFNITDEDYTALVDGCNYPDFVTDKAGYGLAQWTFWSRKQGLLNFTRARGVSIADLEAQLDFLMKELSEGYKGVLATLRTARTVAEASNVVLMQFEKPADQSEAVQKKRVSRDRYGKDRGQQRTGDRDDVITEQQRKTDGEDQQDHDSPHGRKPDR